MAINISYINDNVKTQSHKAINQGELHKLI